jgi:WD40 repeat protein
LIDIQSLGSPSRSILYSAHLTWVSPIYVLVAAGTVFGEVIVWKCKSSLSTGPSNCVLAIFSGHEGSIFGVNISPPILDRDKIERRLIASCSDDRTIRIWDISGDKEYEGEDPTSMESLAFRGTGFDNDQKIGQSRQIAAQCLAVVMGHTSRIWRVKFLIHPSCNLEACRISVLSYGEDSTSQLWNLSLEGINSEHENTSSINHLETFSFHRGKHLWSTAMYHAEDGSTSIATGGADGKISCFVIAPEGVHNPSTSLSVLKSAEHSHGPQAPEINKLFETTSWDINEILEIFPVPSESLVPMEQSSLFLLQEDNLLPVNGRPPKISKVKKTVRDSFNRHDFISETEFIMTTTFGRVLLGNINSKESWEELPMPEQHENQLKSYSVVRGVPEHGLAILAGSQGAIYFYQKGRPIRLLAQGSGKIADLFVSTSSLSLSKKSHSEGEKPEARVVNTVKIMSLNLVATTLGGKVATLFALKLSSPTNEEIPLSCVEYVLPDKLVVTSIYISKEQLVSLAIYFIVNT